MLGETAPLAATIPATAAAATSWDLIIVGAGPAGGATAIRTARAGLRVLLLDRESFPRPKVCGCCLSPLALAELGQLDVTGSGRELGPPQTDCRLPLGTVQLLAGGRAASLRLPPGAVQSRESLDPAIVRLAIGAGAAWLPQTRVVSCRLAATGVSLMAIAADGSARALSADRIVLAGGLADAVRIETAAGSRPAARRRPGQNLIGIGATLPRDSSSLPAGQLVMAVGRSGYCGLVRLEDGQIDLAAAVAPACVVAAGSPSMAVANLLAEASGGRPPLVERVAIETATTRATPPLTHQTPVVDPSSDRIYRVGDATGYVEPFTGEGIGWALHAARLLSESVIGPTGQLLPPAEAAARYSRRHRKGLRQRHRRCRLVALALRSPWLVAAAVRAANWFPGAAGYVAQCCTGNAVSRGPRPTASLG